MNDRHLEPDELAAYHAGELPPEEEKRVQDHLVACRECSELLLDLASFGDPGYGAEEPFTQADADAVWEGVRTQIGREGAAPVLPFPTPVRTSPPRWLTALAASLLVAVLGLSLWVASLRRTVGELSRPQLNAPVIDLSSGTQRGGDDPQAVEVPAGTRLFTLILVPRTRGAYDDYEVEIAGEDGQVWRERGLEPNAFGSFSLTLSRRTLGAGSHRVRLFGLGAGEQRELLGEYALRLAAP